MDTPTTVYVLFVNYNDGTQDVACGVFTSEDLAMRYTSDRYTYRVEKFVLNEHA